MNGDGTFKDKEARPGSPFKGMPTLTISTKDWGGKPLSQKRVLTAGDFAYIQGSEVAVKGKTMFERRQASRK